VPDLSRPDTGHPPGESDVDIRPDTADPEEVQALRGVPASHGRHLGPAGPEPLTEVAVLALLEAFADRVEPQGQALSRLAREMAAKASELAQESAAVVAAVRSRQAAAAAPAVLTRQQLRVVQLAALDRDNGQIAADLGVSGATVRSHWRDVYRRLGVRTRAGAVGKLLGSTPSVEFSPPDARSTREGDRRGGRGESPSVKVEEEIHAAGKDRRCSR